MHCIAAECINNAKLQSYYSLLHLLQSTGLKENCPQNKTCNVSSEALNPAVLKESSTTLGGNRQLAALYSCVIKLHQTQKMKPIVYTKFYCHAVLCIIIIIRRLIMRVMSEYMTKSEAQPMLSCGVRPSVTFAYSVKTNKHIFKKNHCWVPTPF